MTLHRFEDSWETVIVQEEVSNATSDFTKWIEDNKGSIKIIKIADVPDFLAIELRSLLKQEVKEVKILHTIIGPWLKADGTNPVIYDICLSVRIQ